jgi:hypothetical protein
MNYLALAVIAVPWCLVGTLFFAYVIYDKKHVTWGDILSAPLAIAVGPIIILVAILETLMDIPKKKNKILFDWRKR